MTPRRICRFILVGVFGAVLQVSLLYLFTHRLGLSSIAGTLAAVEITVLHNFIWHERFTWRDRALTFERAALRLLRFHASNGLVSLIGNTALLYYLLDRLKAPIVPSALAAIFVCSLANFLLADRWVFAVGSEACSFSRRSLDTSSGRTPGYTIHQQRL